MPKIKDTFESASGALEYYFSFVELGKKGINYAIIRVDKSKKVETNHLDLFATIGCYFNRLTELQKFVLAFYFKVRTSDRLTAQRLSQMFQKSFMAHNIEYQRIKALKRLSDDFTMIGLVVRE